MTEKPILSVSGLTVSYPSDAGPVQAVEGVTFSLVPGKVLALVGESGSGKSSVGLALMGLGDAINARVSGSMTYEGADLLALGEAGWRKLRGDRIAMVFQDATAALNPVLRIGAQIGEVFRYHRPRMSRRDIRDATLQLLERVGIPDAGRRIDAFPHQLSGGMQQRVVIAAAVALKPAVLIADEPVAALDEGLRAQSLSLLQDLVRESETALLLISHELDLVAGVGDHLAVMQAGRILEAGPVEQLLSRPRQDYTRQLLAARGAYDA